MFTILMHTVATAMVVIADYLANNQFSEQAEFIDKLTLTVLFACWITFLLFFVIKARASWLDGQEMLANDVNQKNFDFDFWYKLYLRPFHIRCQRPFRLRCNWECFKRFFRTTPSTIYNRQRIPWYLDQAVMDGYKEPPTRVEFGLEPMTEKIPQKVVTELDRMKKALDPQKWEECKKEKERGEKVLEGLQGLWDSFRKFDIRPPKDVPSK
eukprot:gb/GEZN01013761.1/.p1 GENE.gb/GEZN01013761.1/~~gb/GEZN01013761.1/.p1  ORF type:complete len:247 (-),score=29.16 gb/GEZN01013761.1/:253-885(-)